MPQVYKKRFTEGERERNKRKKKEREDVKEIDSDSMGKGTKYHYTSSFECQKGAIAINFVFWLSTDDILNILSLLFSGGLDV